jgi:hypothetical protein
VNAFIPLLPTVMRMRDQSLRAFIDFL